MPPLRIDEVLQMAMQLEESGIAFYTRVAKGSADDQVVRLCCRCADDEKEHLETFRRMREAMATPERVRKLDLPEMQIIQGVLDDGVMPSMSEAERLAGEAGLGDMLGVAMRMEEDSVRFYECLVSGVDDADALREIIDEERGHIEELRELRETFGG